MNISVSEEMYRKIHEGVRVGCHTSVSEYIRSLVRRDRQTGHERSSTKFSPPRRANDCLQGRSSIDE